MRTPSPSSEPRSAAIPRNPRVLFDAFVFSSGLAAAVAGALTHAASRALAYPDAPSAWAGPALATAGTLVVYNVDRLRDLTRDRTRAPERSEFIERHHEGLRVLTLVAAAASIGFALLLPARVWALCGATLVVGLLHRRIKGVRGIKVSYVTASWLMVVVGIPALSLPVAASWGRSLAVLAVLGCGIGANLIATNLSREREHEWDRALVQARNREGLQRARLIAGLGVVLALVGPPPIRGLVLIPAFELLALLGYRPVERHALVHLDGALLVGALLSIVSSIARGW